MNNNQLQRLLNLVKKTGDRLVVADKDSDDIFVLMCIEDYEDLSDLSPSTIPNNSNSSLSNNFIDDDSVTTTDEEILDQINENIAEWREDESNLDISPTKELTNVSEDKDDDKINIKVENLAKKTGFSRSSSIPSVSDVLSEEKYQKRQFDNEPRRNFIEEEDLSNLPEEAEEKFYLEPVE